MAKTSTYEKIKVHQPSVESFRIRVKKRSDKLMNYFLGIYFTGGFISACFYNTWIIALLGGVSLLATYYGSKKLFPRSALYQYVLSVVFGLFMIQYIYQMKGMFELYFVAFVSSTILITYQNWKLQIPLMIILSVHLAVYGYHQGNNFQDPYVAHLSAYETQRFLLHIILAGLIFFICGLWSYLLKKYSDVQVAQTKEMERLQNEALIALKEQAIIESNTRFSYAAQATSDAIWDRNYSEDEVFWGDGYRALFGYEINPVSSKASFWASKVHPDDLESVKSITQKAKDDRNATSWSCEYRFLKANGEYAFVKEKAIILRDEKGIPCRTIGALQDITEIKQRELKLKELNESLAQEKYYLDTLMDNMPDAIYFKDKQSRFVRVSRYMINKHLASRPGATIEDILGKTDFDLQDEKHAKEAFEDEQEIQRTKKPKIDYIEKEITEDGSERWVTTSKLPMLNPQGEVTGTFGISRDITKIKMLEKEHHEAQLKQAIAQNKFEIASEVMHDIGNAMVGFGSYLTRIKNLQKNSFGEQLKSLVAYFKDQRTAIASVIGESKADAVITILSGIEQTQWRTGQDMLKAINEQLNIIANIEEILNIQRQHVSGFESKQRKPADIRSIINDTISILADIIEEAAIDVSVKIDDDLPCIKGDRTKLMQLIMNIIKNSVDATAENKSVKQICITAHRDTNKLVLQIRDNGKGFDEAVAGNLFNKGFTTKTESFGNGLYNCKTIIESHEGTIDIVSEGPGKGALTTIGFKILAA